MWISNAEHAGVFIVMANADVYVEAEHDADIAC